MKTTLVLNPVLYLVHIRYDDGPNILCSTIPVPIHDLKDLKFLCVNFVFRLLQCLFFVKPLMELIHVWHGDRDWSKILCGIIPNPVHDLKVKVTDLEFLYKSFVLKSLYNFCFFAKPSMDFIPVWHDWTLSNILCGAIPIPVHDLKVKVPDLNFLC